MAKKFPPLFHFARFFALFLRPFSPTPHAHTRARSFLPDANARASATHSIRSWLAVTVLYFPPYKRTAGPQGHHHTQGSSRNFGSHISEFLPARGEEGPVRIRHRQQSALVPSLVVCWLRWLTCPAFESVALWPFGGQLRLSVPFIFPIIAHYYWTATPSPPAQPRRSGAAQNYHYPSLLDLT